MRVYPYDKITSHIIGYVQNVNSEDLKKHKNEGYNSTSVIGRNGIEAAYEEKLRGITSGKIELVDKNDKVIKDKNGKKRWSSKSVSTIGILVIIIAIVMLALGISKMSFPQQINIGRHQYQLIDEKSVEE